MGGDDGFVVEVVVSDGEIVVVVDGDCGDDGADYYYCYGNYLNVVYNLNNIYIKTKLKTKLDFS